MKKMILFLVLAGVAGMGYGSDAIEQRNKAIAIARQVHDQAVDEAIKQYDDQISDNNKKEKAWDELRVAIKRAEQERATAMKKVWDTFSEQTGIKIGDHN
jgi:hypothetical protein